MFTHMTKHSQLLLLLIIRDERTMLKSTINWLNINFLLLATMHTAVCIL